MDLLIGLDTSIDRTIRGTHERTDTILILSGVPRYYYDELQDTIWVPGRVKDVEVDHARREFWVGYQAQVG